MWLHEMSRFLAGMGLAFVPTEVSPISREQRTLPAAVKALVPKCAAEFGMTTEQAEYRLSEVVFRS